MSIRKPIVAGMFYEQEFDKLNKQIEECFLSSKGPGSVPQSRKEKDVKGIIMPHAGYVYSGACAAWGYKEIAESSHKDVYIIIGPNHSSHETSISEQDWETPLGIIKSDKQVINEIKKQIKIGSSKEPHYNEHSIEVQIPFLQYACRDDLGLIKIVAISLGSVTKEEIEILAKTIKETMQKLNKSYTIIASSDFTHYGPNFAYIPFVYNIRDNIERLDFKAIDIIRDSKKDFTDLLEFIRKEEATICGSNAIALLMKILENSKKRRLLQYYVSGDIIRDYSNSVSYASIIFE